MADNGLVENMEVKKTVNYLAQNTSWWYSRQAERATVSEVVRHGVWGRTVKKATKKATKNYRQEHVNNYLTTTVVFVEQTLCRKLWLVVRN